MINYYLLTKPGIILGNLITLAAGFLLASKGTMHLGLFIATVIGLAFTIASACVFNNYIDRKVDRKMERTKNRPLAQGLISGKNALLFATVLGILGLLILFLFSNTLATLVAGVGFFVYVVLYSFWKCHTIYGTAIGSIAGAVPPVVGYCAVSNQLDLGAFLLFLMLVFWQMPHFFAIALLHFNEYSKAGIPVLPVKKGVLKTKVHMLLYILGFILTVMMFTYFNYTGYLYLFVATSAGLLWLWLSLKGFSRTDNQIWGRQMFRLSLLIIVAVCFVISIDVVN